MIVEKSEIPVGTPQLVKLQTKMVYGRVLTYPACEFSRFLADLMGTKTFSPGDLRKLKGIGFEIEYIPSEE